MESWRAASDCPCMHCILKRRTKRRCHSKKSQADETGRLLRVRPYEVSDETGEVTKPWSSSYGGSTGKRV